MWINWITSTLKSKEADPTAGPGSGRGDKRPHNWSTALRGRQLSRRKLLISVLPCSSPNIARMG